MRCCSCLAALFVVTQVCVAADGNSDWHHWRGPTANGASAAEANPPTEWSATKNVKWKIEVPGKGSSTPIISGNQIILLTAIKTERTKQAAFPAASNSIFAMQQEPGGRQRGQRGQRRGGRRGFGGGPAPTNIYEFVVASYDRSNGKELWKTVVAEQVPHEAGHRDNTFASSSPVTDGKHIYVSFGSRGIHCLDMKGNKVWKKDYGRMETRAKFGEGSSPAVHGDTVVVPWDHEGQSFIVALDAKTGDEKWKKQRDERTTWATPLIVEHEGRTQVITNGHQVRSYDLANGDLIWECGGQVDNPIPSPVLMGDHVICMTGYKGNSVYAISLDSKGNVTDSDKVKWHRNDAAPYVPSPVLYKGQLYFLKSNNGILSSVNATTGKATIEQSRLAGIRSVYSSPVAAADRIYLTGRDGSTLVLRHSDKLEVLATNKLGEPVDASPAIVGNELFLRGAKHLFCIAK